MKCLSCLVLLLIISCSGGETRQNIEETSYRTSGVEQFFLPELPAWANYSARSQCFKSQSFHYLDFSKLQASYQLSYQEMIELQAQYNDRLESYFRSTTVRFLKPVEEASFFSNTLEQVRGGIRQFKLPNVPEIQVVLVDSYIQDNKIDELKKMAKAGVFDEKLPLIFSACLSKQSLSQWLSENNLDQVGFYTLSAEWLSPFSSDMKPTAGLHVELQKLLSVKTKITTLSSGKSIYPNELIIK